MRLPVENLSRAFLCGECGQRQRVNRRSGKLTALAEPKAKARRARVRSTGEWEAPVRREIAITGRYDLDRLMGRGLLPPPTPEMRADLERRGTRFRERYPIRLGEVIYRITSALGIPTCRACQRRRLWLNRISVWGWWR
jgi:hypothetical protein